MLLVPKNNKDGIKSDEREIQCFIFLKRNRHYIFILETNQTLREQIYDFSTFLVRISLGELNVYRLFVLQDFMTFCQCGAALQDCQCRAVFARQ